LKGAALAGAGQLCYRCFNQGITAVN